MARSTFIDDLNGGRPLDPEDLKPSRSGCIRTRRAICSARLASRTFPMHVLLKPPKSQTDKCKQGKDAQKVQEAQPEKEDALDRVLRLAQQRATQGSDDTGRKQHRLSRRGNCLSMISSTFNYLFFLAFAVHGIASLHKPNTIRVAAPPYVFEHLEKDIGEQTNLFNSFISVWSVHVLCGELSFVVPARYRTHPVIVREFKCAADDLHITQVCLEIWEDLLGLAAGEFRARLGDPLLKAIKQGHAVLLNKAQPFLAKHAHTIRHRQRGSRLGTEEERLHLFVHTFKQVIQTGNNLNTWSSALDAKAMLSQCIASSPPPQPPPAHADPSPPSCTAASHDIFYDTWTGQGSWSRHWDDAVAQACIAVGQTKRVPKKRKLMNISRRYDSEIF